MPFLVLIGIAMILAGAAQQAPHAQLLPSPVTFSGTVVDENGKPLSGVWVGGRGGLAQSDAQGRFTMTTAEPAVVFRKIGFHSFLLRTEARSDLAVTLRATARRVKACGFARGCATLKGWQSRLCFPRVSGVSESKQTNDVDYGVHYFILETPAGKRWIRHGSGVHWSSGPKQDDVWNSVEYSETVYEDPHFPNEPFGIVDARGKLKNGKQWRWVGTFGEAADYWDMEPQYATRFDKVLDGVCLRNK